MSVEPTTAPDESDAEQIHVGDHVRDRDEDDGARMLVVGLPSKTAGEYQFKGGRTVASVNPDYPADDDVVECVFPQRTDTELHTERVYAYPASRLLVVHAMHDAEDGDSA